MRYTPGRSVASARTRPRIAASSAAQVGSRPVARRRREGTATRSPLAPRAEDRRPPVDGVGADQPRAAAEARRAGASVRGEPRLERAPPPARVPVVAKARAALGDGLAEHVDERVAQRARVVCRER